MTLPPIVGIGASAGGLEALESFFRSLPTETGAAFVVIQHLSPEHKSVMDEILARCTTMDIEVVDKRAHFKPDTLYLTAPRVNAKIVDDRLEVSPVISSGSIHHPTNVFFQSMAERCGSNAVAIVLSGTGSDGAHGSRAVRDAGGVVLVQDPNSARFDGMPRATIATGAPDFELSPVELARQTASCLQGLVRVEDSDLDIVDEDTTEYLERILNLLEVRVGIDFREYKIGTILRRTQRRMAVRQIPSLASYLKLLANDESQCEELARDYLIHVTRFFRDPEAFKALQAAITERVNEAEGGSTQFRVWDIGCSTGEEAYSLAMTIERVQANIGRAIDYKIFATDLDEQALRTAGAGRYDVSIAEHVPKNELDRFFERSGDHYVVKRSLRDRIVFARHDVQRDPPFSRSDLVVCRNLLIYFQVEAQDFALQRMLFSVQRGGIIFLGPSETADPISRHLDVLDTRWRIFRSQIERGSLPGAANRASTARARLSDDRPVSGLSSFDAGAIRATSEALIRHLAVAAVIVDAGGHVVFTAGPVADFLRIPSGVVSTRLADLLPSKLAGSVALAVRRAEDKEDAVVISGSGFEEDGQYSLEALPVLGTEFSAVIVRAAQSRSVSEAVLSAEDLDEAAQAQIQDLERELEAIRESLQVSVEQLETANEELQSVNEELLSSNEELQSTNEELHSVNEELYTVNAEHQVKIQELAEVTGDLENLLNSTRVGLIFVDGDLRLRRFTADARIGIPLDDRDLGRSLTDLSSRLKLDLADIAATVIRDGTTWEGATYSVDGERIGVSARQYGNAETSHAGCLITIVDLSLISGVGDPGWAVLRLAEVLGSATRGFLWIRETVSGRFLYLSAGYEAISGHPANQALMDRDCWINLIDPVDLATAEIQIRRGERRAGTSLRYRLRDADVLIEDICLGETTDDNGQALSIGMALDRSADLSDMVAERSRSGDFELAMSALPSAVLFIDHVGSIQWMNEAARQAFARAAVLPTQFRKLIRTEDARGQLASTLSGIADGARGRATLALPLGRQSDEGSTEVDLIPVGVSTAGRPASIICSWFDDPVANEAARSLKSSVRQLELEAHHDPLTGLLNRRGLERRLTSEFAAIQRNGESLIVILIDCDEFKKINDEHSHSMGDRVLVEVAKRARELLRPTDALGRIGGDEFVAVLPATRAAEGAHVAEALRRAVAEQPVVLDGESISVSISVGVAPVSSPLHSIDSLIREADVLLQNSKSFGRNRISTPQDSDSNERAVPTLLESLQVDGGVYFAAQPIHAIDSGEQEGLELLARSTNFHDVGPSEFFSLARSAGQLEKLDRMCFEKALMDVNNHNMRGQVHINLFPSTLLAWDLDEFSELLQRCPDAVSLCIELSEQQFIGNSADLRDRLIAIRESGVKIALDDIGFGRSALETLIAVEPEVIKIDRSLISNLDGKKAASRPLKRLISVLGGMSSTLIAEGIESELQANVVSDLGIQFGQGYYWGQPTANSEHG